MAERSQRRAVTCTYHCRACGTHFHSLASFDAHRTGSWQGDRVCNEPGDDKKFVPVGVGECRIAAEDTTVDVTVWTLAADLVRQRRVFASKARVG